MTPTTVYEFLKDIGALAGLGWLLKSSWSAYRARLRKRGKQILVAATTGDGLIHRFNYPDVGPPWVRAGTLDLGNDQLSTAEFVDALEQLNATGYVRQLGPDLYDLAAKGLRKANVLKNRIKAAEIPSEQNSPDRNPKKQPPVPGAAVAR